MIKRNALQIIVGLLTTIGAAAHADVVVQPVAATTTMGTYGSAFNTNYLIDQVGLTTPYVSGVTDASSYFSTHADALNEWQSAPGTTTGFVSFDLGSTMDISGFLLWNSSWSTNGPIDVDRFTLFTDVDFNPTNGLGTNLGFFNAADSPGSIHDKQAFGFASTSTRYVHMEIQGNHGSAVASGFSEAAFVAVPEPTSAGVLGIVGCLYIRRRRRN